MNVRGQTIVVTGCSSGVGAETARRLGSYGALVIGIDRNDPAFTLNAFVRADLATPKGIEAAVAQLSARIDHVCHVAGVPGTMPDRSEF